MWPAQPSSHVAPMLCVPVVCQDTCLQVRVARACVDAQACRSLAQGLQQLVKERPDKPVEFLAHYLLQRSAQADAPPAEPAKAGAAAAAPAPPAEGAVPAS